MRKNTWWLLLATMGLLLTLAACGPKDESVAPTIDKTTPIPEATPTPKAAEATPIPPTPTPVAEPVATEVPSSQVFAGSLDALQSLNSYRYYSLFRGESTEGGEVTSGSMEIKGERGAPDREHVTWTDLRSGQEFEVIRIAEQIWLRIEGEWQEMANMPAGFAETMLQGARMFGPVESWNNLYMDLPGTSSLVGEEVVNGILTLHYTSSYEGWGALVGEVLTEAKGDVWVAVEGFPVKYVFQASGTDTDGRLFSIEWAMELTDINQPISIGPPM